MIGGQPKLTKQQKRDLKRAAATGKGQVSPRPLQGNGSVTVPVPQVSVYKRETKFPLIPVLSTAEARLCKQRFIAPSDGELYKRILGTSYSGLIVDGPKSFNRHQDFQSAMLELNNAGQYQYDFTQPGGLGTKVAKTLVTRCLVGIPGITYKYLGLRMFGFPWTAGEPGATPSLVKIGEMNDLLCARTKTHLAGTPGAGSCQYNLTLINLCSTSDTAGSSKPEPLFGKDKITVSWHADSSLQHYSSIAVYHFAVDNEEDESWRIAVRVKPNAEGPSINKKVAEEEELLAIPALAFPLKSGSCYFLLDDFNHHHQHSVIQGKTERYASTHRVSRQQQDFFYIRSQCQSALNDGASSPTGKFIRSQLLVLSELEFEWIRQFFIQGSAHRDKHEWWKKPMEELIDMWRRLEEGQFKAIQSLLDAASGEFDEIKEGLERKERKRAAKRKKSADAVEAESFVELLAALEDKLAKRAGWLEREEDEIYRTAPAECQPIRVPFPLINHPLAGPVYAPGADKSQKTLRGLQERVKLAHEEFMTKESRKKKRKLD